MARGRVNTTGREPGWSARGAGRKVTRKPGARPVRPVGYHLVELPQTPQAEIDICLACPLPDCRTRGCPLRSRDKGE